MNLSFRGTELLVDGERWTTAYPVADARAVGDRVVVIYDCVAGPRDREFRNLEAFDRVGTKLWTAENPTTTAADAYVNFIETSPLIVGNFAGYDCVIDESTGRLIKCTFTK